MAEINRPIPPDQAPGERNAVNRRRRSELALIALCLFVIAAIFAIAFFGPHSSVPERQSCQHNLGPCSTRP